MSGNERENERENESENNCWLKLKMKPNSRRAGFMTLFSSSLGTGFLAIPKSIACWGVVPGLLMVLIAALNAGMAMNLLSVTCAKYKEINYYPKMVEALMGKKWGYLLGFVLSTYLFGSLIAYHLVIWKFFSNLFQQ